VAFDASRSVVLSGGGGGSAKTGIKNEAVLLSVTPAHTLQVLSRLDVGADAVAAVALHPRQPLCAIGAAHRVLLATFGDKAQSLRQVRAFRCESKPEHELRALVFSRSGSQLASGGADGVVRLWAVDGGGGDDSSATKKTKAKKGGSASASASASASEDGGRALAQLQLGSEVQTIDFAPDDTLVLAASTALLRIWKVASAQLVAEIACPTSGAAAHRFRGAGFALDAATLITGHMRPATRSADGESLLTMWRVDGAQREPLKAASVVAATRIHREHHTALAVSSDGKHVVTATASGKVSATAIGGASFTPTMKLTPAHGFVVTAVSGGANLIVSASLDHTVGVTPIVQNARNLQLWLAVGLLALLVLLFVLWWVRFL
jgi:WD40 repeat protein